MTNAIVEHQSDRLSPAQVRDQVNHIQRVMEMVMKKDHHYGTVPGTPKPSLWKPGAEKLLSTFRLACNHTIEDLSDGDHHRFRVTAAISTAHGDFVCDGVGEASTEEEKYCWRAAVCDEEFDSVDETMRRVKYKKGRGGSHYTVNQIRTNPADLSNTVLKMAAKRAMVAAVLIATAASDIFAQDIEDLPEGLDHGEDPRPPIQQPRAKNEPSEPPPAPPFPKDAEPQKSAQASSESPKSASSGNVVVGIVEKVDEATGNKNGKDWTRYDIFVQGEKYATFSETFASLADDSKEYDKPVSIEFKQGKWGRDVVNMVEYGG